MDSSSDDEMPLVAISNGTTANVQQNGNINGLQQNGKRKLAESSDLSDDDRPLAKRVKSAQNGQANGSHKPHLDAVTSGSSDDDAPLALMATNATIPEVKATGTAATSSKSPRRGPRKSYKEESDEEMADSSAPRSKGQDNEAPDTSSSDDEPLISKVPKRNSTANGNTKTTPKKKRIKTEESDVNMSSGDDEPVKRKPPPKKRAPKKVKEESDSDMDDNSNSKVKPKPNTKKEPSLSQSPKKPRIKKEEEEEEIFKWWEQATPDDVEGDGTKKWDTLKHAGVLFPPPYVPVPDNVKILYDGQPVDLPPESEEVAGFFAAMLDTDHAKNDVFQANFFKDWLTYLKDFPPRNGVKIKKFELCDFRPLAEYIESEKARLKRLSKPEKQALKESKAKEEAPFATCLFNGRPEKVGNFRVEPPGLFRGRGEHPKKGCVKKRVEPKDIVINIGEDEEVPTPGMPGKWKEVVHNNTVTWLAHWKENINGQCKYVFLAATSSIKGKSDRDKFEKARELKQHIDRIRKDYQADLKSKVTADRQRATAMYLIDKYALRAGNEKGDDEADTVGCCSLRLEHVTLDKAGLVILDFLGKDSIRYYKEIDDIDPQVFKNLRLFKASPKKDADLLFDRVTTSSLNAHLRSYMKGLTAKVFRTYNASTLFERELLAATFKPDAIQQEKVNAYNAANKLAAELCNHQRAASKNHAVGMAKMSLHIQYLKHQKMGMRRELFEIDPKMKKKHPEWVEPESELEEEEDVIKFEDEYYNEKKKELMEGWERSKKTMEETGGTLEDIQARKEKVDKKLEEIEVDYKLWLKHRTKPGFSFRGKDKDERKTWTADQLVKQIEKQTEIIAKTKLKQSDKESLKTISLTTSKINYLDPRITASYCARHDIPISQFFTKALRKKFPWAMDTPDEWRF